MFYIDIIKQPFKNSALLELKLTVDCQWKSDVMQDLTGYTIRQCRDIRHLLIKCILGDQVTNGQLRHLAVYNCASNVSSCSIFFNYLHPVKYPDVQLLNYKKL